MQEKYNSYLDELDEKIKSDSPPSTLTIFGRHCRGCLCGNGFCLVAE
ncbi:hypothetical protein ES703_54287 [subsurface metagenome]